MGGTGAFAGEEGVKGAYGAMLSAHTFQARPQKPW